MTFAGEFRLRFNFQASSYASNSNRALRIDRNEQKIPTALSTSWLSFYIRLQQPIRKHCRVTKGSTSSAYSVKLSGAAVTDSGRK